MSSGNFQPYEEAAMKAGLVFVPLQRPRGRTPWFQFPDAQLAYVR